MSDTDSLYRLSVTPPPQRDSRSERTDHNNQDQFGSTTPRAQSSKTTKGVGDLRNYVQTTKPFAYRAPIAKMTATPPKDPSSAFKTPTSNRSNKGKGRALEPSPPVLRSNIAKAKEAVDYQAEADAIEEARDLADPDFRVTQDSDAVIIPRKRRRESQAHPSPPSTKAKQLRQRNRLYAKCSDQTKNARDKHIARIQENWGLTPDRWMPVSIMPSTTKKVRGKKAKRQPLLDPRDWNSMLLVELAYLSNSTKNRPDEAFKALQDAVSAKNRGRGGPGLLPTDVQRAIRRLGSTTAGTARPRITPPANPAAAPANLSAEQLLSETTAGMDQEELPPQLPSPRSPTFGREVVIKQESRPVPPVRPSSSDEGGWDGYDAELDKFEELDLQWKEEQAGLAVARVELARFLQRKRLRELTRQHGRNRRDAILLRAEEGEE